MKNVILFEWKIVIFHHFLHIFWSEKIYTPVSKSKCFVASLWFSYENQWFFITFRKSAHVYRDRLHSSYAKHSHLVLSKAPSRRLLRSRCLRQMLAANIAGYRKIIVDVSAWRSEKEVRLPHSEQPACVVECVELLTKFLWLESTGGCKRGSANA